MTKNIMKRLVHFFQIATSLLPIVIYIFLLILLLTKLRIFPIDNSYAGFESPLFIFCSILYFALLPSLLLSSIIFQFINIFENFRMKKWKIFLVISLVNYAVFFIEPYITIDGCMLSYFLFD